MMAEYANREDLYSALFPRKAVGLEVGVKQGDNAEQLWNRCEPRLLHLVDAWIAQPEMPRLGHIKDGQYGWWQIQTVMKFQPRIRKGQVIVHQGYSAAVLPLFPAGYFGWAYLDGDHRFQAVFDDLKTCDRIMAPDAVVAVHDYVSPEDETMAASGAWGVVAAVERFCKECGWQILAVTKRSPKGNDSEKYPTVALKRY